MWDAVRLLLVNIFAVCLMVPAMEHYLGRTLSPGVEWVFFWVGVAGLALLVMALGVSRFLWRQKRQQKLI